MKHKVKAAAAAAKASGDGRPSLGSHTGAASTMPPREPEQAYLVAECAACKAANEVAVPLHDTERSFPIRCYACTKLNQLTIDTGGGPLVVARTPSEWTSSILEKKSPASHEESKSGALSRVPLKKRAKPSLALAVSDAPSAAVSAQPVGAGKLSTAPPSSATRSDSVAPASTPKKVVVRFGQDVVALFHDGYYYHGTVEDAKVEDENRASTSSFLVAWDDGDQPSWGSVTIEDDDSEDDVWFAAEVVGPGRTPGELSLKWADGGEIFEAPRDAIRCFVSAINAPLELKTKSGSGSATSKPKKQHMRSEDGVPGRPQPKRPRVSGDAGAGAGGGVVGENPADVGLLKDALAEVERVWGGDAPRGRWKLQTNVRGIMGLHVCTDFLDANEVEALRTLLGAHRAWARYTYTAAFRNTELASIVERLDFTSVEVGSGNVGEGAPMWQLDAPRARIMAMLEARLQHVFGEAVGLWGQGQTSPNAMQLTRLSAYGSITNHWDRRDQWQDGIATICWSELPTEGELRGEPSTLRMERGPKKQRDSVAVELPPGSAYVLMGAAQGATRACAMRLTGRATCNCCWTHGVRLNGPAKLGRQSLTLRALLTDADQDSTSDAEEASENI